jgi:hypothetical protein
MVWPDDKEKSVALVVKDLNNAYIKLTISFVYMNVTPGGNKGFRI